MVFNTDYRLMQIKSIAECYKGGHSAILSICIKLPNNLAPFIMSIFEWPLKAGFTVTSIFLKKTVFLSLRPVLFSGFYKYFENVFLLSFPDDFFVIPSTEVGLLDRMAFPLY